MLENRWKGGRRWKESTDKLSRMHNGEITGGGRISNWKPIVRYEEISIERKIEIRKEISDRFVK